MHLRSEFRSLLRQAWRILLIAVALGLVSGAVAIAVSKLFPPSQLGFVAGSIAQLPVWALVYSTRRSVLREIDAGRAAEIIVTPLPSRDYFLRIYLSTACFCALVMFFALPIYIQVHVGRMMGPIVGSSFSLTSYLPSIGSLPSALLYGFSIPLFVYAHAILFPASWRTLSGIVIPVLVWVGFMHLVGVARDSLLFRFFFDLQWRPLGFSTMMRLIGYSIDLPPLVLLFFWIAPRFKSIFGPLEEKPPHAVFDTAL